MLTTDLLRYRIDERTITPRYLTRKHAAFYLGIAEDLIQLYRTHVGRRRKELETALSGRQNERANYKIVAGLAKILDKFAEFTPERDLDHAALREAVFDLAERHRPIVQKADLIHTIRLDTVLKEIASEVDLPPEMILRHLYGDLPDNHILRSFTWDLPAEDLLRRYNLALAQGILYRCVGMHVRLWDSYKAVFHYLKLARLMHQLRREGDGYVLTVTGPLSVFRQIRRYGIQMARFLPGLLLARRWQMAAAIQTEQGRRWFMLDQNCGLHSTYPRDEPFDSKVEEAFFRTFSKRAPDWRIEREGAILDLGDTVLIPDFKLVHKDGYEALLEIVGFWTPEYLKKKIDKVRRADCGNLLLAVHEGLNCSREDFRGEVVFFKTRVKVKEVMGVLERMRQG